MPSRRQLLQTLSLAAAWPAARLAARRLSAIGVQLYTVRDVLPKKPAETLRRIRELGYREIEATYDDQEKIWREVAACGMKPVSIHLKDTMLDAGQEDALSRALDQAKGWNFVFAVIPALPEKQRSQPDVVRALGDRLNRAGEKARAAGLRLCYHNHAFDFRPLNGTSGFQMLMDRLDPKLCGFEVDCFWVSVAGGDPAALLRKLAGRVPLLHLKDKAAGTPQRFDESVDHAAFQEVGNGTIAWPKVLDAAVAAGVEHYFVEQDYTAGDPIESLRQSYAYLHRLQF